MGKLYSEKIRRAEGGLIATQAGLNWCGPSFRNDQAGRGIPKEAGDKICVRPMH
jgi:hypothetical protein